MNAFLYTNSFLTRADAPAMSGSPDTIAANLGFELAEELQTACGAPLCAIYRPHLCQEIFLTFHGIERNVYALLIWEQPAGTTFIYVLTPFDLVTALEYIARYYRAMDEVRRYGLHAAAASPQDVEPVRRPLKPPGKVPLVTPVVPLVDPNQH